MKPIKTILNQAEMELQEVIAIAAKDGDYKAIDLARRYAVQLHEMQAALNNSSPPAITNTNTQEEPLRTNVQSRNLSAGTKKKGKKSQYPKFEIEHNSLTRIGWSKKGKKEYSHKASKNIYDLTVAAMEKLSKASAGPFMAEDIIAKVNEVADQAIPAYQIYVVIGYLKDQDCVKQIGREGYNIPTNILQLATSIWK